MIDEEFVELISAYTSNKVAICTCSVRRKWLGHRQSILLLLMSVTIDTIFECRRADCSASNMTSAITSKRK